jgi:steroid delta-isomerase-like uncharacterized protein
MSDTDDILQLARDAIDALNQGDEDRFKAHVSADAVWRSAATGETSQGPDAITVSMFGYRSTFPDFNEQIVNAFADGQHVAIETLATGTYEGRRIPTVPGSGDRIELPVCYIMEIREGQITRLTAYMDYRTLMAQLEMLIDERVV